MTEKSIQSNFRLSAQVGKNLDSLATRWGSDKTGVVCHAINLLADETLGATLGAQFMSAEQALRCWAEVIFRASADNSKTFSRGEWNLLADANNGCSPMMTLASEDVRINLPTTLLWANTEDDIRLNGGDKKWKVRDPKGFVDRLRDLDFVHAWAAVVAVQWFWEHSACAIDHTEDDWWTVDFRLAHKCKESTNAEESEVE